MHGARARTRTRTRAAPGGKAAGAGTRRGPRAARAAVEEAPAGRNHDEDEALGRRPGGGRTVAGEEAGRVAMAVEYVIDEAEFDEGPGAAGAKGPRSNVPVEVRYFDQAKIFAKAGDGGSGAVAFRREKFVPNGGPSGGNGARGGHVWLEVERALNGLSSFRRQVHYRAKPGGNGQGSSMHGAAGADVTIKVPPGTLVRRAGEDAPLVELMEHGETHLLLPGGRGGRGNASFKSSQNQVPQLSEKGATGEEGWYELELKVVADVGIVGAPNAGKSTLLAAVSDAKPKIANYPFTTLVPNLGVCESDFKTVVLADVPGLLEGAHDGVGLGLEFLRHCERCEVLVHAVDGSSPDPVGDFRAIRTELELFSPELAAKPAVVAYTKMDLPDSSDYWEDMAAHFAAEGFEALALSAVTGEGVQALIRKLHDLLGLDEAAAADATWGEFAGVADDIAERQEQRARKKAARDASWEKPNLADFVIEADRAVQTWHVSGRGLERFAQMTDWNYYEALKRFQRVLKVSGVTAALTKAGIREGDTVVIGETEFRWDPAMMGNEGRLYETWLNEIKEETKGNQGASRWPHSPGGA